MTGYNTVRLVQRLDQELQDLGMRWAQTSYDYTGDTVMVHPRDQELPHYSRDADLFCGTLEQLDTWLQGVRWARRYDEILKLSKPAGRARKEQDERNRQLVTLLKDT